MFSSLYHRIDSEFLLLLELKCFVHTFKIVLEVVKVDLNT